LWQNFSANTLLCKFCIFGIPVFKINNMTQYEKKIFIVIVNIYSNFFFWASRTHFLTWRLENKEQRPFNLDIRICSIQIHLLEIENPKIPKNRLPLMCKWILNKTWSGKALTLILFASFESCKLFA
jgi:hypothetical protein